MFLPQVESYFTGKSGVVDFDRGVFRDLRGEIQELFSDIAPLEQERLFHNYIRYYISDYRPI